METRPASSCFPSLFKTPHMLHISRSTNRQAGGSSISRLHLTTRASKANKTVAERQEELSQPVCDKSSVSVHWLCGQAGPGSAACLVIQPRLNRMFPSQAGVCATFETTDPLHSSSLTASCAKSTVCLACD